jgi:hypothetical protein
MQQMLLCGWWDHQIMWPSVQAVTVPAAAVGSKRAVLHGWGHQEPA